MGSAETRSGIYRTVEAANSAGIVRPILEADELEELESRGINPYYDKKDFSRELEKQAKANGVWLDNSYLDGKELLHDQKAKGTSENDIYRNEDGTFTKLNNLSYVRGTERHNNLAASIDRIETHNELFPNVAYTVEGFMQNKNGVPSLVLAQPEIIAERNATQEEISDCLKKIGFNLDGVRKWSNGHEVWSNGKYEIADARPANVLKGKNGELYFIDTIPHSVEYMTGQTHLN
ncbi:hypothetical protein AGMMS49965_26080 [Bacteroidia bacterium]|nr:hypothetical protein AGMMS49965_26080 [Bacteroidia bacterium]